MSDPKELRKRLESLNRSPLPEGAEPRPEVDELRRKIDRMAAKAPRKPPQPGLYSRDAPVAQPRPIIRPAPRGKPVALEEAIDGIEVASPHGGKAFLITASLSQLEGDWTPLCEDFCRAVSHDESHVRRRLLTLCEPHHLRPENVVFVDIETTGLSGQPLFLIGTLGWEASGLAVRQYFARNYAEERAVLSLFLDSTAGKKLLVTFNGKTFDVPYIKVRAAANRVPFAVPRAHFDLLHEARRAWHTGLPDHKLQTLERAICHRVRAGDIPGSEIPEAYHAYVRTANAAQIVEILHHNMLDLVTLADLMVKLPG